MIDVLSKLAGLWVNSKNEIMYSQASQITFICPMIFNYFPLDTQVTLFIVLFDTWGYLSLKNSWSIFKKGVWKIEQILLLRMHSNIMDGTGYNFYIRLWLYVVKTFLFAVRGYFMHAHYVQVRGIKSR